MTSLRTSLVYLFGAVVALGAFLLLAGSWILSRPCTCTATASALCTCTQPISLVSLLLEAGILLILGSTMGIGLVTYWPRRTEDPERSQAPPSDASS